VPHTDVEAEILAFLRSEQDSYYRGDFDAFVDHWHHGPEVRRIVSGPQVGSRIHTGWDELLPRFKEGFRQFPQNFDAREVLRWDNIQIVVSGDLAWVSYDQIVLKQAEGLHAAPFAHEIKIVQRFNGLWKVVCVMVVAPGISREDTPLIELDADGRVVAINALARQRLKSHLGLLVSAERPRARLRQYDPGLQKAIKLNKDRLATNLPRGFQNQQTPVVPLGEDEAGNPMYCWVRSEQERILISFDDASLLRSRLEAAATTVGLSPAQLDLAELLASGQDLSNAAVELGVSVNTVRTQLRRMFEKTQTHNQAALVSRLLNVQGPE
jgi:DNA-binding CsgD family transcriptional regulator